MKREIRDATAVPGLAYPTYVYLDTWKVNGEQTNLVGEMACRNWAQYSTAGSYKCTSRRTSSSRIGGTLNIVARM